MQHYLDEADRRAPGARPVAGRRRGRAARLELGNVTGVREQVRGYGWENVVGSRARRPALRRPAAARARPASPPSAVAHAGARHRRDARRSSAPSTRSCSSRCPIPTRDRIVAIWDRAARRLAHRRHVRHVPRAARAQRSAFDALAVAEAWQPTHDRRRRAGTARRPARQRRATSACSASRRRSAATSRGRRPCRAAPNVVILSDALWRRRFGGDPRDRRPRRSRSTTALYTVIGVMPRGFENVLAPAPSSGRRCSTTRRSPPTAASGAITCTMIGRLRPGVSVERGGARARRASRATPCRSSRARRGRRCSRGCSSRRCRTT